MPEAYNTKILLDALLIEFPLLLQSPSLLLLSCSCFPPAEMQSGEVMSNSQVVESMERYSILCLPNI